MKQQLVSRGWYFGVICASCGLPVYCLEDKDKGEKPVRFRDPGIFNLKCQNCSHSDLYHTSDIYSLRAP